MLVECENCEGTGREEWEAEWCEIGEFAYRTCTVCNGTGSIKMTSDEFEEMNEEEDDPYNTPDYATPSYNNSLETDHQSQAALVK